MTLEHLPFALDEAKHAPPSTRAGSVEKTDAITRLVGSTTPFATIVAPAGYGKSTLLARWAEVDPRPFAWIHVDGRDDDSIVFLRGIAAAINRVQPLSSTHMDALVGPGDSIWTRVPHIGNAMSSLQRPLVLALDDLHAITNQECLNVLAALFAYIPPGSLIAVASRIAPSLPLARWRVQGMLTEVDANDLRLDDGEADVLLRGADVVLAPDEIVELNDRTEGWPAGLYLGALSMRAGAAARHTRVERFSGNDRFVSAYFRLEILSRLGEQEASFLVHSSVLERMSGPMCDAVLASTASAGMLESLERSNRFVVSLDGRGEWYRYHHLFQELLRSELDRSEPAMVRELNRRAMDWCLANDQPEAALRYGLAAGEIEAVAGLIDELALGVHYDGRMETLEEWLRWFGDDDLRRFPALAVYAAWICAMTGRASEADRFIALADRATSAIPLSDDSPTIEPWIDTLRAAMMPDGVEGALEAADRALDHLPTDSQWISDAVLLRGVSHVLLGSLEAGRVDLQAAYDAAKTIGALDIQFLAQAQLALLEARVGAWGEAARHAHGARASVEHARLTHYAIAALAFVAVSRVAIHERRPAEARAAMTYAHRLRPQLDHGMPWLTAQVAIELARGHLALGEADAARTVLADLAPLLRHRPGLGTISDDARVMTERAAAMSGSNDGWAVNLTAAELRLLPYLSTHLTFPEIASRLFVSSHTVRTQAKAIYRKFDASSRAEAIDRAIDVGLLEPMFPHRESIAG